MFLPSESFFTYIIHNIVSFQLPFALSFITTLLYAVIATFQWYSLITREYVCSLALWTVSPSLASAQSVCRYSYMMLNVHKGKLLLFSASARIYWTLCSVHILRYATA